MRQHANGTQTTVLDNIRWGLWYGIFMAVLLSALAALILLTRGTGPFSKNVVSLGTAIAIYAIGGVLGGAILGLLRPLTRYFIGVLLISIPVSLPIFAGSLLAFKGSPWSWDRITWITIAMLTFVIAPFFGIVIWFQNRRHNVSNNEVASSASPNR
jgi:hypothetical protein